MTGRSQVRLTCGPVRFAENRPRRITADLLRRSAARWAPAETSEPYATVLAGLLGPIQAVAPADLESRYQDLGRRRAAQDTGIVQWWLPLGRHAAEWLVRRVASERNLTRLSMVAHILSEIGLASLSAIADGIQRAIIDRDIESLEFLLQTLRWIHIPKSDPRSIHVLLLLSALQQHASHDIRETAYVAFRCLGEDVAIRALGAARAHEPVPALREVIDLLLEEMDGSAEKGDVAG